MENEKDTVFNAVVLIVKVVSTLAVAGLLTLAMYHGLVRLEFVGAFNF